jgi:hypothetical protein
MRRLYGYGAKPRNFANSSVNLLRWSTTIMQPTGTYRACLRVATESWRTSGVVSRQRLSH